MCEYCTTDYNNRKRYIEKGENCDGIYWFIKDQFMGETMPRVLEVTAYNGIHHQTTLLVPIKCCPNCGKKLTHPWSEEYKQENKQLYEGIYHE